MSVRRMWGGGGLSRFGFEKGGNRRMNFRRGGGVDFTIRWWVDAVHVSLSRVACDVGPWCQWENGLWTWSIRKIAARFSREGWGIGGFPLGSATDSVCTLEFVCFVFLMYVFFFVFLMYVFQTCVFLKKIL